MTKKKKMLVACHDAGGAEVVSAYLKGHQDAYEYTVFVGGPAWDIFKRKGINAISISEDDQHSITNLLAGDQADVLLVSIDWSSTGVRDILHQAKRRGIHRVVYLDHWVYYRERLGYPQPGWEINLPDEFWAGDSYGLELAMGLFPS